MLPDSQFIKETLIFLMVGGICRFFLGIALGTDQSIRVGGAAVVKNNQGDR